MYCDVIFMRDYGIERFLAATLGIFILVRLPVYRMAGCRRFNFVDSGDFPGREMCGR